MTMCLTVIHCFLKIKHSPYVLIIPRKLSVQKHITLRVLSELHKTIPYYGLKTSGTGSYPGDDCL